MFHIPDPLGIEIKLDGSAAIIRSALCVVGVGSGEGGGEDRDRDQETCVLRREEKSQAARNDLSEQFLLKDSAGRGGAGLLPNGGPRQYHPQPAERGPETLHRPPLLPCLRRRDVLRL